MDFNTMQILDLTTLQSVMKPFNLLDYFHSRNRYYLENHKYTSEGVFIIAFKKWVMNKPYIEFFAIAVYKEAKALV